MNVYIADQIAREHADRMMAEAALARRVREARNPRRRPGAKPTHPQPGATAHFLSRPLSAFHAWLAAGQL